MLTMFKEIKDKIKYFSKDMETIIKDSSFEKESNRILGLKNVMKCNEKVNEMNAIDYKRP